MRPTKATIVVTANVVRTMTNQSGRCVCFTGCPRDHARARAQLVISCRARYDFKQLCDQSWVPLRTASPFIARKQRDPASCGRSPNREHRLHRHFWDDCATITLWTVGDSSPSHPLHRRPALKASPRRSVTYELIVNGHASPWLPVWRIGQTLSTPMPWRKTLPPRH